MTYNKKGRGKVKDDNAMYYLHIVIQDSKIAAIKIMLTTISTAFLRKHMKPGIIFHHDK